MLRENQIKGLLEANKHNLVAGLLVNFRNDNNDTFFITISQFKNMIENIQKKSFNANDLINAEATYVYSIKKRSRYTYDIRKFINVAITHA